MYVGSYLRKPSASPVPGIPSLDTTTQQTSSQQKKNTKKISDSTQASTGATVQTTDMQNISDQGMQVLNQLLATQDELSRLKDQAAATNLKTAQDIVNAANPAEAKTRAAGQTADLSRQLLEKVLPQITGASEISGTGGNALAQLLAQEAAIRTAEAQNRAIEQARAGAVQESIQGSGLLGQLVQGTSSGVEQLLAALEIAKGATQKGGTTTSEAGTTTTKDTSTVSDVTNAASSVIDPLAFAKLQTGKQSPTEKALAAFIAQGGDVSHLSGATPFDYGQSRNQQSAFNTILNLLGG